MRFAYGIKLQSGYYHLKSAQFRLRRSGHDDFKTRAILFAVESILSKTVWRAVSLFMTLREKP